MSKITVPSSLLKNMKAGSAAVIVGHDCDVSAWKNILADIKTELNDSDSKEIISTIEQREKNDGLSSALDVVVRFCGEQKTRSLLKKYLDKPSEQSDMLKVLSTLPFHHVWTTFPGDGIQKAFGHDADSNVYSYDAIETIDLTVHSQYILKLLGNFESYVISPKSFRAVSERMSGLRNFVRDIYTNGSLLFVGFKIDDPDFVIVLDKLLSVLPSPQSGQHYLVLDQCSKSMAENLLLEHNIEVISTKNVVQYLKTLSDECTQENIVLSEIRPDVDDVDGWLTLWSSGVHKDEAESSIQAAVQKFRKADDDQQLVNALIVCSQIESDTSKCKQYLEEIGDIFNDKFDAPDKALFSFLAALKIDPLSEKLLEKISFLGEKTGLWEDIIQSVTAIAETLSSEEKIAPEYWYQLGAWINEHQHDYIQSLSMFRRALNHDNERHDIHKAIELILEKENRWTELVEQLFNHLDIESDEQEKVSLYVRIGEICEGHLSDLSKAMTAYKKSYEIDNNNEYVLSILIRLARHNEDWLYLVTLLEQKIALIDASAHPGQITVLLGEIADIADTKLGDIDRAIEGYKRILVSNPGDQKSLERIEALYLKNTKNKEYIAFLKSLEHNTKGEIKETITNRRIDQTKKITTSDSDLLSHYESVFEQGSMNAQERKDFSALLRSKGEWEKLISLLEDSLSYTKQIPEKIELYQEIISIYQDYIPDDALAIKTHISILKLKDDHLPSLEALATLYQNNEQWNDAVKILKRHAALIKDQGAPLLLIAADLLREKLNNVHDAYALTKQALGLQKDYLDAICQLITLCEDKNDWESVVSYLEKAADISSDVVDKVSFYLKASKISFEKLSSNESTLALCEKVLAIQPHNVQAIFRVSKVLIAQERLKKSEILLIDLYARFTEKQKQEKKECSLLLGNIYKQEDQIEDALFYYQAAFDLGESSIELLEKIATTTYVLAMKHSTKIALWKKAEDLYRQLIEKNDTLTFETAQEAWYRIGVSAQHIKAYDRAIVAFNTVLEKDKTHALALQGLIELSVLTERFDLCQNNIALIEKLPQEHYDVVIYTADVLYQKFDQTKEAIRLFALVLAHDGNISSHFLHKLLEVYVNSEQWNDALTILNKLILLTTNTKEKIKYNYAAATIVRDRLGKSKEAISYFKKVLDEDFKNSKAFSAIVKILTANKDWVQLVRMYRQMIKRFDASDVVNVDRLFHLWRDMGEICWTGLQDAESAVTAFQISNTLLPNDSKIKEILKDIQRQKNRVDSSQSIERLHHELATNSERIDIYRDLAILYRDIDCIDESMCLFQALELLRQINDEERKFIAQYRSDEWMGIRNRISDSLREGYIVSPDQDQRIDTFLTLVGTSVSSVLARSTQEIGLNDNHKVDVKQDKSVLVQSFVHAAHCVGFDTLPSLYLLPTAENKINTYTTQEGPVVCIDLEQFNQSTQSEIMFLFGRHLTYLLPPYHLVSLAPSGKHIEQIWCALLSTMGFSIKNDGNDNIKPIISRLKKTMSTPVMKKGRALAEEILQDSTKDKIQTWRLSLEKTADRMGFILANDLLNSAKQITQYNDLELPCDPKEKLREILSYMVSKNYFYVRNELGLSIKVQSFDQKN